MTFLPRLAEATVSLRRSPHLRDAVTERRLTVGTNTFNHWYDYDDRGLLWKVFASTAPAKPATPDVTFTYRPSGQVQDRQFQGVSSSPSSRLLGCCTIVNTHYYNIY